MKQLKNGYIIVTKAFANEPKSELLATCISAAKETIFKLHCDDWEQVKDGVLAAMRAVGGKQAVIVDDTKQNIAKETIYYRINENGGLKQFVPTVEEAPGEND